jgi:hypothetical protein
MAGLGTGILKNTNGTGVPSIAVAGDFPTLNQSTSGTAANATNVTTNIGGTALASAWSVVGADQSGAGTAAVNTAINGTSGYLVRYTGAHTTGNSVIYDDGTNVGIGTQSLTSKMTINDGAYDGELLRFEGTSPSTYSLKINNTNSVGNVVAYAFHLRNEGVNYFNNLVLDRGNVGIGTPAPTEKLTVKGNISDTGNISTTGTITSAKDSTTTLAVGGAGYFYCGNASPLVVDLNNGSFHVLGPIMTQVGNSNGSSITFGTSPGIGSGEATLQADLFTVTGSLKVEGNDTISGKTHSTVAQVSFVHAKDTLYFNDYNTDVFNVAATKSDNTTKLYLRGGSDGDAVEIYNSSPYNLTVYYGPSDNLQVTHLGYGGSGGSYRNLNGVWFGGLGTH